MIYYSVIPAEVALQEPEQSKLREVEFEGISMIVQMGSGSNAQIVRLLSPDPQHYLDPRFQPGNTIKLPANE